MPAFRLLLALAFLAVSARAQSVEEILTQLENGVTDQDRASLVAAQPPDRSPLRKLAAERGAQRWDKADYDGAIKSFRAALALAQAASDEKDVGFNLRRIGNCYQRKRDLAPAIEILKKAAETSASAQDRRGVAEAQSDLSVCLFSSARLDEAERAARESIAAFTDVGDKKRATAVTLNLSTFLGEKGDQESKAALLRQVIRTCEDEGFNDYLVFAINNLGVFYFDQGDYERSLQHSRRTLELMHKYNKADPYKEGMMLSNLGVMHQYLGHEKEALESYNQAIAILEKLDDQYEAMHAHHNRAALYRETGKLDLALAEIRAPIAYFEQKSMPSDSVQSNAELAGILLARGDAESAMAAAEKALAQARAVGNNPNLISAALQPLGAAYVALQRPEQARAAFLEAITAVESVHLGGSQDERENYLHAKAVPYQGMVTLLAADGKTFEALQYAERAKARVLLDVLRGGRAEITRAMSSAEKQRERELAGAVAKLDTRLAREGSKAAPALLLERTLAANQLDEFRAKLYAAHPELRSRRADFQLITEAQIAELLPDAHTALLEYTVTKTEILLFAIARDAKGGPQIQFWQLRDAAGLPAQIESFRQALAARDLQYRAAAQRLYSRVVGPAASTLAGKKRIVIVPDGPLWNLPFQALVSPQGRHMIEDAALFYAPSLTAAREMRRLSGEAPPASGHTLLALGGPTTAADTPPLTESIREVQDVVHLYGARGAAYVQAQAAKQRWKTEAPQFRVLHLATHGILNSNTPLDSYLVMSRVPGETEESRLTAREILGMNLQADLAVLSACEMARGRFRFGEGIIGMSWAFLVAGAPTTVVSQWKVDSASTRELMVSFHRNLKPASAAPLTRRAEALRASVLDLLKNPQYRHPFYWAGFVMIGNGF